MFTVPRLLMVSPSRVWGLIFSLPPTTTGRGGWPGGLYSKILVEEGPYQGRMFDQQMEVREYGMSRATAHFDARFRVRGAEVK